MSGINVPTHYVRQFATEIALLLQQRGSKLRNTVTVGSYVGEQASPVDQVGAVEMQEVIDRFGAMPRIDAPADRRWVFPSDWHLPQLIDKFDKLRLLLDPMSSYVQAAVYGAGRKMDDLIISAAFGAAQTGKTGATATPFPAAQQVAANFGAASNVGLTVEKIIEAKRILMSAEVDVESDMLTCIITSKQHANLLGQVQVTSRDFNSTPVLVNGMVTNWLGVNFLHCERLGIDGSSFRRVPLYAKSGMHLGIWGDIKTEISQRDDLTGLPWQAYVTLTAGATRLEEKRVVEIKCFE